MDEQGVCDFVCMYEISKGDKERMEDYKSKRKQELFSRGFVWRRGCIITPPVVDLFARANYVTCRPPSVLYIRPPLSIYPSSFFPPYLKTLAAFSPLAPSSFFATLSPLPAPGFPDFHHHFWCRNERVVISFSFDCALLRTLYLFLSLPPSLAGILVRSLSLSLPHIHLLAHSLATLERGHWPLASRCIYFRIGSAAYYCGRCRYYSTCVCIYVQRRFKPNVLHTYFAKCISISKGARERGGVKIYLVHRTWGHVYDSGRSVAK